MGRKQFLALGIGLWISIFLGKAQNSESGGATQYFISGKILDEGDQALEYATVQVHQAKDSSLVTGGVSDAKGQFRFPVPAGNYYLIVQFISYQPQYFSNVKLGPRNPSYQLGTLSLAPDSETLSEVEVVAEKSTMELQLDKRVFNVGKDLSNLGGSATQILDNIPSVTVDVEGNVSLRGSQNVRILINGRQSGLAGIGSTDALRLLQGDLIERVEVITNPSARYDAEGEVGIINIILKKEKRRGINGAFNLNVGHPEAYGASFNLNYRSGFVNFFGSYGINYRDTPGFGFADQRFFDPESGAITSSFITDQNRSRERLSHTFRVGADFFINDKNTITVSGLYRKSDGNNNTDIQYLDFDGLGNLDSTTVRFQDEDEVDDNVEFEINYKRTFDRKGQELTANFTWLEAIDEENANLFEDNIDNADLPFFQRSFNTENERNFLAQLDYVHPFLANAKFETGFKATLRDIDNDFLVEEQDLDGDYEALPGLDNQYRYQEYVYAA
ncbi:MAG: outer membrane beta-barrel protein, partial [Bacteroidota bacterium]